MRFEVPQYIDIEDKIFGPLTWRQFVYLSGGVGGAIGLYLLFSMIAPGIISIILFAIFGLPLALLGFALSFYPVNSRPFVYFLEAVYNYVTNARLYLWKRKSDVVYKEKEEKKADTIPIQATNRGSTHKSISSLTRSLELQALQKPE